MTLQADNQGQIVIDASVRLDVEQLAMWEPDRIRALFEGLGQVLAAMGEQKRLVGFSIRESENHEGTKGHEAKD